MKTTLRAEEIKPGDIIAAVGAGKVAYVLRDDRARKITCYSRRERIIIRADYDKNVEVTR